MRASLLAFARAFSYLPPLPAPQPLFAAKHLGELRAALFQVVVGLQPQPQPQRPIHRLQGLIRENADARPYLLALHRLQFVHHRF